MVLCTAPGHLWTNNPRGSLPCVLHIHHHCSAAHGKNRCRLARGLGQHQF